MAPIAAQSDNAFLVFIRGLLSETARDWQGSARQLLAKRRFDPGHCQLVNCGCQANLHIAAYRKILR